MIRAVVILLFCALLAVHVQALDMSGRLRKTLSAYKGGSSSMPAPVLRIASLEFDDLAADWLFLKALVFEGTTEERKKSSEVRPEEWKWLYETLNSASELDPYFADPYFLANAELTWGGHLFRETNALLDRGVRYRVWDWLMPYFVGFNYFYFLHDDAQASVYLYEAAKRPGPSVQLASLASRLAYKEKKTENAIIFLEVIAQKTEDKRQQREFATRIQALRIRLLLEKAVASYKQRFHVIPSDIGKLVARGIITEIPLDPYGGSFSVTKSGEIESTSDHELMPHEKIQ